MLVEVEHGLVVVEQIASALRVPRESSASFVRSARIRVSVEGAPGRRGGEIPVAVRLFIRRTDEQLARGGPGPTFEN
jgi:hypothetical protein